MCLLREERTRQLRMQEQVKKLEHLPGLGQWEPILDGQIIPPRRRVLTPIQEAEASRQAKEWHQQGVVERIKIPPVINNLVLVAKKDGRTRVCVDCTPANKVTRDFDWPLPRLQDVRYRIRGNKYFARIDLKDAFFRIRIAKRFRHLTAFMVNGEAFQFTRMPFGLKTAPATFQRFMDWGLAEFTLWAIWYIDDILITGNSLDELNHRSKQIRERLAEMKCTVNETKSQGASTQLLFAGLFVSPPGISANQEKVSELLRMAPPRTKAEAQSALGMVSYLRDFIPLVGHLTALLYPDKQGLRLSVTEYARHWERLLRHISTALTVNHHWRDDVAADLYTDASQYALGIIVLQEGKIVAVASRKLTSAETRYSATDREHLGLVYAADKFKLFLHRRQAITRVWSDHSALTTRQTNKMTPRQMRWHQQVTYWMPNVAHVKGKCNPADFISRWKFGTLGAKICT